MHRHVGTWAGIAAVFALLSVASPSVMARAAATGAVNIELNKGEAEPGACQFYFVVKKDGETAFDEFKVEFIVFAKDGSIIRRLIADLGPMKAGKTSVKVFKTSDDCDSVDGLLINDVKSCGAVQKAEDCMALIKPSSRAAIKLFL